MYNTNTLTQSSEGNLTVSEPKHAFYNDVSDELAQQAISELHDQTMYSFGTPSPPPAWKEPAYDGRRAYVKTLKDNAIPPETRQQRLLDLTEVEWDVKVMNCGHSPFLNYPEELATWTTETIKKWQAL